MTGARWRKSSYSGNSGGNCVEVAAWRKASYSSNSGGACVEVGAARRVVAVRDSKDPDGPRLVLTPESWRAFTCALKEGSAGRA